ncbi:hypothetical protein PSPO01_03608 [Paraphaeosphaeria sporulosa]
MRGRRRLSGQSQSRNETQAKVYRDGQGAEAAAAMGAKGNGNGNSSNNNKEGSNGTGHTRHASRRPAAADLEERRQRRVKGTRISKCRYAPFTGTTTLGRAGCLLSLAAAGSASWPGWTGPERRTAHPPPASTAPETVEDYTVDRSLTILCNVRCHHVSRCCVHVWPVCARRGTSRLVPVCIYSAAALREPSTPQSSTRPPLEIAGLAGRPQSRPGAHASSLPQYHVEIRPYAQCRNLTERQV